MRSGLLIFPALLSAAACAASKPDIIQVGPWFPARPYTELRVLASRDEITSPWGAIAVIHSEKFPSGDRASIKRQEKNAAKLAAGAGADGIIITEEAVERDPRLDVYQEPESFISALAFKYVADVSSSTGRAPAAR